MDHKKKHRKVLRTSFTKAANELEDLLSTEGVESRLVKASLNILQQKIESAKIADNEIYELLLEEDATEEVLLEEIDKSDDYKRRYNMIEMLCQKFFETSHQESDANSNSSEGTHNSGRRSLKLPTLEFRKFSGEVRDWLPFWAQFKKIHNDSNIDSNDKVEYLIQAMLPGSRARQLVDSFPATGDNYSKMLDCLMGRFGRDDLQIEVYVRELLTLVISNTTQGNKVELSLLYDKLETQLRALETLGIASDKYSAMLFPLIESCFPPDLLRVWQRLPSASNPTNGVVTLESRLNSLMLFLKNEVQNEQHVSLAAEGFGLSQNSKDLPRSTGTRNKFKKEFDSGIPTATGLINNSYAPKCIFCQNSHDSTSCFKANKMSMEEKRNILFNKKACFRCLKIGHHSQKCKGRFKCILCQKSHLVLMCPGLPANKAVPQQGQHDDSCQNTESQVENSVERNQTLANHTNTHVFLQTLRVNLKGLNGSKPVRVLLDSGSQRSYILKSTAAQLGYEPKRSEKVIHCLFGGREAAYEHKCYDVTVSSDKFMFTLETLDQPIICGDVSPVFRGQWSAELANLGIELSDSQDPGPIELLLGADVAGVLYTGNHKYLSCGLTAIETRLGWTIIGKVASSVKRRSSATMTTLNLFVKDASIEQLWELDALGIKEPTEQRSREEMALAAKELFLETVRINKEGRYEVRLPWVDGHPPLPSNYGLAQKRLKSNISKLKRDGMFSQCDQVFKEWESDNVIERVDSPVEKGHYLPHRVVVKENSATTKLRPVFDASAHERDKPSLNHCLEKGLNLVELIPSLLLRFREYRVGVVSDIRKAFLQISVHENDRDFLKFLWEDDQLNEVMFRFRRVVFGVNSSPFLLGVTIDYHLDQALKKCDGSSTYSRNTIERLRRSFYVDNCVTSLRDEDTLATFIQESVAVMAEGAFELRGWEYSRMGDSDSDPAPCSVLGLNWHPQKDVLTLGQGFLDTDVESLVVTKREILSVTQKVFDPIGFTSATVLVPKLILQKLWAKQITWDQPVDEETAQFFKKWMLELPYLLKIEIPRWTLTGGSHEQDVSIHTFCDASKDSYACAIFLRVEVQDRVNVFLLASKARVSPLKKMTIPRLELLAAVIGARLFRNVRENLDSGAEYYFWSDSATVISWIQRTDHWGTFVWNRVSEIRQLTPAEKWRHVPGLLNPADLPSRGCSPKQLFELKWWEGPAWLYQDPKTWPSDNPVFNEEEITQERRKQLVLALADVKSPDEWNLLYFSNYNKTIRMLGWIFRFYYNMKHSHDHRSGELTAEEFAAAETFAFKLIQQEYFSGESDKNISCLQPFYDENGVIRLKSRVSNREDTEDYRFPIVLPSKHPLVQSLIWFEHRRSCHVGTQGLLNLLRERYWIVGGRRSVRNVITKCVVCKRQNGKPFVVQSPPLPLDRVREAVPFGVTGVDFAGPLFLRNRQKAWVCLFTCAAYRAVHLELTASLTTTSFLQVFRRFVARRGRPKTIYSDNGTNFVGAENAFSTLDWDLVLRDTSVQRIVWKFNPPTAAWWGGFWERLIGILKQLLRKMLGRASLDYEDLMTLLCDCEAVVNARPLTYCSEEPKDLVPLTPSVFLREQIEWGLPDCDSVNRASLCRKVRHIQRLREDLRDRFRVEYLGQLKLHSEKGNCRPIRVGDVVLIGNDNTKRMDWPLGRVGELLPGKDGQVRLVRLETSRGGMLRPLQRLYPLECAEVEVSQVPETAPPEQTEGSVEATGTRDRASTDVRRITRCGRVLRIPARYL